MASIRERVGSIAVLYRVGKTQTSKTFDDRKSAERFKTLVELLGPEKAAAEMKAEHDVGLTLDQLAETFFDWKGGDIEARTLRDYRRDYANWIRPALGNRQAEAIDERDVQELVDKMARRLDAKSVADRHAILGAIYKYGSARSRQLVTHNPCLETQLPKRKKKAPKGFSLPEWDAMHRWGAEHEPDADDLLLFIASTGWRFSECTPLTPLAFDDRGDVEVTVDTGAGRRSVWVPVMFVEVLGVHRRDEQDRIIFAAGEAKSRAALRKINLPPEGARMVRRRLVGLGPQDLVFTNSSGSQWRSSNFLERVFSRILKGAGISKVPGMGPHYLRHTHVMMLDEAGVSAAKTQRRIGHENLSTTFGVYGGKIGNALSTEELVRLDALVSPPPAGDVVVAGTVVRGELG